MTAAGGPEEDGEEEEREILGFVIIWGALVNMF